MIVCQINSEWSGYRDSVASNRVFALLKLWASGAVEQLSEEDYAFLAEQGYLRNIRDEEKGWLKVVPQCVWVQDRETKHALLAIGERIWEKHKAILEEIRESYVKAVLEATPPQLRKMCRYVQQNIFYTDGDFVRCCLEALVQNGKLKEPKEWQKPALSKIVLEGGVVS